ncbi:hypothetical protein ACX80D_02810 [Arthrobacter sp. Sr24]
MLDLIDQRPVVDSTVAAMELGLKQPNVSPPLKTLVDAGILNSKAQHKLGPYWQSDEILGAIDEFAKRVGAGRIPKLAA